MKSRIPDSLEHAITVILAELGDDEAARIIGKSSSLIRKAADPDHDFTLNLNQAMALDRAYADKTGEAPPIFKVMERELRQATSDRNSKNRDIVGVTLHLQQELGRCSEDVRAAIEPNGARRMSRSQIVTLMEDLDNIERTAADGKTMLKGCLDAPVDGSSPKSAKGVL